MSTPRPPEQDALLDNQAFLRRLARGLVADEHRADDLVQDAALLALRRPPRAVASMRVWLARVARSLASNSARDERVRAERELDAPSANPPRTPAEVAQQIEVQREVLAALARLDEPYKSTLFLRYWDDLGPSAIAERTGVAIATVKTHLARGLARMRTELDRGHGGERSAWALVLTGGLEGWERAGLGAATAAGGLVMGTKLALGAAVGGALIAGTWWALKSPKEPEVRGAALEQPVDAKVALAEPTPPLREPESESRIEAPPPLAAIPTVAAEPEQPAWRLDLELRGWDAADTGPFSIVLRGPKDDSPSVTLERPLAEKTVVDLGPLFVSERPNVLKLRLDHPQYLPLDASVLVPLELRAPEAAAGVMESALTLTRAKAFVTGTVVAAEGALPDRVRVTLYALNDGRPREEPVDSVHAGPGGAFRLRADNTSDHVLVAHVEPERLEAPPGFRPETRHLSLLPTETRALDPIVLGEGATIAGQVSFSSEAGPQSGTILCSPASGRSWGPMNLLWLENRFEVDLVMLPWDESGRFRISGLAPGPYQLSLRPVWTPSKVYTVLTKAASEHEVLAPALDVRLALDLTMVSFSITSNGAPASRASVRFVVREDEHGEDWETRNADEQGRLQVLLDPSAGLHCKVQYDVHPAKDLRFLPAELMTGGPIEIAFDEAVPETATLAIRLGPRARELAEGLLLDVRLYDRANPNAMNALENGTSTTSGPNAIATIIHKGGMQQMVIEEDRTQVLSKLPPATYVVDLVPRADHSDRPCLLLSERFEVELRGGERVDHDWYPEVGGALRINFVGGGVRQASLRSAAGESVRQLQFRCEKTTSTAPIVPGVNDVFPALPAGSYELRIRLEDNTTRTVPVLIEAGRVNDVVVDLAQL